MRWPFQRTQQPAEVRALDHETFFGVPMEGPARLSHEGAAGLSPVWAAVRCVSESMASLSCHIVKDGQRVPGHWLERLLSAPNAAQGRMEFLETMISAFELRGNAYAEILRDGMGVPQALWPMRPGTVRPERKGGRVVFHVATANGEITVGADRILHWRFGVLSPDGITGTDPVALLQADLQAARSARDCAKNFFENGANPSGILEHPAQLTDEAAERLRRQFKKKFSGSKNSGETLILEEGLKFSALSRNAEESQLLETRTFSVQDCARVWALPPHKLGDHSRSTFSNITEESASFVKNSIRPRCVRLEQSTNRQLLSDDERAAGYGLQFSLDSLLRGSTTERYKAHATGIGAGFITRNEARKWEDLQPLEGLDEIVLMPGQQTQTGNTPEETP
jgi:HK97 family phage portal protein